MEEKRRGVGGGETRDSGLELELELELEAKNLIKGFNSQINHFQEN